MYNLSLENFYIKAPQKSVTNSKKVMIVMHGLGDSLESYKILTKEINVTGLNYLLLNAPKKYYFGYSWYDLPPANPHTGIINSSDLILGIIDKLTTEHEVLHEDIFLCGFSQGGAIAMETFYKLDQKIAGVVALSPRLYTDRIPDKFTNEQEKTPLFMAHGKFDEVINFKETKEIFNQKLSKLGLANFNEYEMGHEIDPDEILALRNWLNHLL